MRQGEAQDIDVALACDLLDLTTVEDLGRVLFAKDDLG